MQIVIPLDDQSSIPLYRQVSNGLQELIRRGELVPSSKLPSSRELAETLNISRFTTSKAYEELMRQAWIETRLGTFVCKVIPQPLGSGDPAGGALPSRLLLQMPVDRLSSYGERIMSSPAIEPTDAELFPELNYYAPAPEQLPLAKWQDMLVKSSRKRDYHSYVTDVLGHEALRRSLADYLRRTRGMRCTYEQIVIFSSSQAALDLLSRIVLEAGDSAVVENPGFPGARRTFASYGARLCPVPVDGDGLVLDQLSKAGLKPKVLYATPSHHDPSGVALSAVRRKNLLQWTGDNGVWIIEDDFDSEYRYGEKPMQALQSMDDSETVIYLSAFWKIMFPVLRLGFAVVPMRLLPVVRRAKSLVDRDFHFIEHEAFAHFINEGHLERHIRRTRRIYANRREVLVGILNQRLGSLIRIPAVGAGTHLLVKFDSSLKEEQIEDAASAAELPMVSTRPYYLCDPKPNEMLIPFAHIDEKQIEDGVGQFAKNLQASGRDNS